MASCDEEPQPLVLGRDYYIENGNWVFKAAYHLRRGQCCESGCRHCPYGFQMPDDTAESAITPPDKTPL